MIGSSPRFRIFPADPWEERYPRLPGGLVQRRGSDPLDVLQGTPSFIFRDRRAYVRSVTQEEIAKAPLQVKVFDLCASCGALLSVSWKAPDQEG